MCDCVLSWDPNIFFYVNETSAAEDLISKNIWTYAEDLQTEKDCFWEVFRSYYQIFDHSVTLKCIETLQVEINFNFNISKKQKISLII